MNSDLKNQAADGPEVWLRGRSGRVSDTHAGGACPLQAAADIERASPAVRGGCLLDRAARRRSASPAARRGQRRRLLTYAAAQ